MSRTEHILSAVAELVDTCEYRIFQLRWLSTQLRWLSTSHFSFLACAPVFACLGYAGGIDLAQRLIDIYFTLFKMILEGHIGRAAAAVKQQEAKHPTKSKDRHRDRQVSMPACLRPFLR